MQLPDEFWILVRAGDRNKGKGPWGHRSKPYGMYDKRSHCQSAINGRHPKYDFEVWHFTSKLDDLRGDQYQSFNVTEEFKRH